VDPPTCFAALPTATVPRMRTCPQRFFASTLAASMSAAGDEAVEGAAGCVTRPQFYAGGKSTVQVHVTRIGGLGSNHGSTRWCAADSPIATAGSLAGDDDGLAHSGYA
jgi:hypothetical protein